MVSSFMEKLGRHRSVIREIFEYGNCRRAEIGAENVFDFSLGNPSVPPPQEVTDALLRLLTEREPTVLHGYTSAAGAPAVREAIADYIRKTHSFPADANLIYMTVGAAAALTIALSALIAEPGEEVIVFAPFFPEYRVFIEAAGGTVVTVPCRDEDFTIDTEALSAAITERTKAVIINSPNNPTGTVLPRENLEGVAEVLRRAEAATGHPIYLLADEPYRELVYDGKEVPYLPSLYRDTLVAYSFSKSLSLPGERIGYLFVSPDAADCESVYAAVLGAGRALGFVCAPSLFQHLLPACLGKTSDLAIYRENRDILLGELADCGFRLVHPDGAFYLFMEAPGGDASAFAELAKKHELLLVPSDSFGYPGYVRISYCVATETVKRAIPAFRALAKDCGLC
ncbi:MAG: pyridoxal phosphate-dependent aminotransferase [Clostridia bacterium]|nr:pyridoxal phosphate-dependent aminotransferase [Clostridia bacterium]